MIISGKILKFFLTQTDTTTLGVSGPKNKDNKKKVLHIPQTPGLEPHH